MEGGVVGGTGDEGVGEMSCRVCWWCGLGEDGRGDRQGDPARMDTGGHGEMMPGAGEPPPCWPGVGEEVAPIQWSEWPRWSSACVAASVTPLCFCLWVSDKHSYECWTRLVRHRHAVRENDLKYKWYTFVSLAPDSSLVLHSVCYKVVLPHFTVKISLL